MNPDGVTGPQDPNTAKPSSTYGRYAGLNWSNTFPVANGDKIVCTVSGQRTDTNPSVQLPPVPITVTVDSSTPVDGRAGNYDTGTRLDYQLHYTVTY